MADIAVMKALAGKHLTPSSTSGGFKGKPGQNLTPAGQKR